MKRSNESKLDDWDDEASAPAGERSSGVRRRRAPAPVDPAPCTSFEEAYQRHHRFVWLRIRDKLRNDAAAVEDVHQQVFLRLDRRIRNDRGVPDPLMPVLLGLVDDEVHNHLRAQRRRRNDGPPDSEMPSSKPDPEQLFAHAEMKRQAEAIFARMRTDEAELIKLAHERGMSLKDIADYVGLTAVNVRVKLHRARIKFAELYRRFGYGSRRRP
jgi:RNA polymerase sigma factor (sigma-70 family)